MNTGFKYNLIFPSIIVIKDYSHILLALLFFCISKYDKVNKHKESTAHPTVNNQSILPSSLYTAVVNRARPDPRNGKSFIVVFSLFQTTLKWVGLCWHDSGQESANYFNPLLTLAKPRLWFAA